MNTPLRKSIEYSTDLRFYGTVFQETTNQRHDWKGGETNSINQKINVSSRIDITYLINNSKTGNHKKTNKSEHFSNLDNSNQTNIKTMGDNISDSAAIFKYQKKQVTPNVFDRATR